MSSSGLPTSASARAIAASAQLRSKPPMTYAWQTRGALDSVIQLLRCSGSSQIQVGESDDRTAQVPDSSWTIGIRQAWERYADATAQAAAALRDSQRRARCFPDEAAWR